MIAAPFSGIRGEVRPEMLSPGTPHLNMAFYMVFFDAAAQALFAALGIDHEYAKRIGRAYFAAEAHILYEREMRLGDQVLISTTLIDADDKRVHIAQEMFRSGEPARMALQEAMFVSVDMATGRPAPWEDAIRTQIFTALDAHNALPRPARIGRKVGILRK